MTRHFILGCIALGLAANPALAQNHDTLTVGMSQFPPDMHPYITGTSIKDTILWAVNRPMVGYARDGSTICVLCTEVPSLANGDAKIVTRDDGSQGMEVTYTLKPNLAWADGVPVTSADVVFSYDVSKMFSPSKLVDKVEAIDALHVRYTLNRTQYDYPRIANAIAGNAILSEHIEGPIFRAAHGPLDYGDKSAFNRHPEEPGLWLGPYRIESFQPNDRVVLVPNPHWAGDAPHFKRVTMRLIDNTSALNANLLSGDVDTVATGNLGLSLDQILTLAKTQADRFDFNFIPLVSNYEHLTVDLDNPLLSDRRTRQAISMAIDRKTIVARLFQNRFEPATSFKYPTQFGWDPATKAWPYDIKAARAMLSDVGFKPGPDGILLAPNGSRFSIDLLSTAGNRTRELIEQVLQTELKAIGIDVVIKNEPARVMFGETLRHRSFQGLVLFQNDMPLDYVPTLYFGSNYIPSEANGFSGQNYMDFHNADMDAAMLAVQSELDPDKRRLLWKRILDIYADEMPEIPIFFPSSAIITPKWMTGMASDTRYGFFTAWIEDWRPR